MLGWEPGSGGRESTAGSVGGRGRCRLVGWVGRSTSLVSFSRFFGSSFWGFFFLEVRVVGGLAKFRWR